MNNNVWVCRSALLIALVLGLIPAISLGYNIGKSEHPLSTQQYAPLQDDRGQLDQQRQQQLEWQRQQQLRQQQELQRQQQLRQQQEWQRQQQLRQQQEWQRQQQLQQQLQQQQEWQRQQQQEPRIRQPMQATQQHPPQNDPPPDGGGFSQSSSKSGELGVAVVVGLVVLAVVIRFWRLLLRLAIIGAVILIVLYASGMIH